MDNRAMFVNICCGFATGLTGKKKLKKKGKKGIERRCKIEGIDIDVY
jgi:hypothetical protein